MGFYDTLKHFEMNDHLASFKYANENDVKKVISKNRLSIHDFASLLSDSACALLELMAQKAHVLTRHHFGNSILLFSPLYISNYCDSVCEYCSFRKSNHIKRVHLDLNQICEEARYLAETGIRHVLVLTGESRRVATIDYLLNAVEALHAYFSSVGIEVYSLTTEEYAYMIQKGVDSLTIYQEVYDEKIYRKFHAGGPKENYVFRIEAPERACEAGMRAVTIGPLLGLGEWRTEALAAAFHIDYLRKHYPGVELSVSLPRMRPFENDFTIPIPVTDRQFVQMLLAFRLFAPEIGITISTREPAMLRDSLLPLGVTKMSAGVCTSVGGRSDKSSSTQFEIADNRSVFEMKENLLRLGYQPVMHDWNYKLFGN